MKTTSLTKIATASRQKLPITTKLKSKTRGYLDLPQQLSPDIAKVLGYLISEGYIARATDQVRFTQQDSAVIDDFCRGVRSAFGLEAKVFRYAKHSPEAIVFSHSLNRYLARVFDLGVATPARSKTIPHQIMTAKTSITIAFLSALYEGDGYMQFSVNRQGSSRKTMSSIEYTTASSQLAKDLVTLLLRFGVFASTKGQYKSARNTIKQTKRRYFTVVVSGQDNIKRLGKLLKFVGPKQQKLKRLLKGSRLGPTLADRIPDMTESIRASLQAAAIQVKPLRKRHPRLAAYNEQRCIVTRRGLHEVVQVLNQHGTKTPSVRSRLKQFASLATSDVVWDEIVSVRKIPHNGWVYDLTIPEHHNFVADNFIVHNSNVAESVRWVLGEQSLKQLRGKDRTDVIFAGSSTAKRRGAASVTITLSNDTGRLNFDAPEVAISRTLNRAGESEYLINGDPVRLFDVQQLLAAAGLGARSYAVISQGMVDQYLTASPAGRRELFDEATGIRAVQLKLTRATSKLKQTGNHLVQLQTVVTELEPRLAVLKRQAQRHTKRQQLEQEYAAAQGAFFQHSWHQAQQELTQFNSEVAASEQAIAAAAQNRQAAEAALVASARRTSASDSSAALRDQLRRAEEDLTRARAQYERSASEQTKLTESLTQVRENLRQAQEQLTQARDIATNDTFFATIRETLTACRELVVALQNDAIVSASDLANLTDLLATAQELAEAEAAGMSATQSLWQQLEGPLQAVARLQAIEHERSERLAAMPTIPEPSDKEVQQLRSQFDTATPTDTSEQEAKLRMDQAREAELAAQRDASLAAAAIEMAAERVASLEAEILRERGTSFLTELTARPPTDEVATRQEVQQLASQLAALGEIDPLALQEYEEVQARYDDLQAQLTDANHARQNAQQLVASLIEDMQSQFAEQFQAIRQAFQEQFVTLFGGGSADLTIVEQEVSELEEATEEIQSPITGVEITVHPPGKKPSHLNLLSGGEKALTSLALLLAIVHVQQPPFVVLDEVDAALDEANSFRFAQMLHELKTKTQCIIITHNRETMGQADVLYGITMQQDGISQVYSVKLADVTAAEFGESVNEVTRTVVSE